MESSNDAVEHSSPATGSRRNRRTLVATILVVGALALLYVGRVVYLDMMASEGSIPPASAIVLPDGAEIVAESTNCGSGGCSREITVKPPAGQTPEALAEELGATPQLSIPGSFLDPRTVWVSARPGDDTLVLITDYTSSEWVP